MKEFKEHRKLDVRTDKERQAGERSASVSGQLGTGRKFLRSLFDRLQQTQGNAYVQRLVSGLHQGERLGAASRAEMETVFCRSFEDVRVHTDAKAAAEAEKLNASAFTTDGDIYFNAGAYAPDSAEGRRLLAHELAHVVQQSRTQPAADSSAIEAEAQNAEAPAAAGTPVAITHGAGGGVHKKEKKEEPSVARHPVEILPMPPTGVISAAGHISVSYGFSTGDPLVLTLQVPSGVSVSATPFADVESGEYRVNDPGAGGARSVLITVSSHGSKTARLQVALVHGSATYLVVFQFLKTSHPVAHHGSEK